MKCEPIETLVVFLGSQNVDIPVREAGRQAHVLPAFADGERQLLLGHDDCGPAEFETEGDVLHFGRFQGIGDQNL